MEEREGEGEGEREGLAQGEAVALREGEEEVEGVPLPLRVALVCAEAVGVVPEVALRLLQAE